MAFDIVLGGSHDNEDWIISSDTEIAGVHTNIQKFEITAGTRVTVRRYNGTTYGSVEINAIDILVDGIISASGAGFLGGNGGGGGGGSIGAPGGGGGTTDYGNPGTNGSQGANLNGGAGGAGGNGTGPFAGIGGSGGGTATGSCNSGIDGTNAAINIDGTTDESLLMGSGGGGGGGGSGGSRVAANAGGGGGGGNCGSSGGGIIKFIARKSITVNGEVRSGTRAGGNGQSGGGSPSSHVGGDGRTGGSSIQYTTLEGSQGTSDRTSGGAGRSDEVTFGPNFGCTSGAGGKGSGGGILFKVNGIGSGCNFTAVKFNAGSIVSTENTGTVKVFITAAGKSDPVLGGEISTARLYTKRTLDGVVLS